MSEYHPKTTEINQYKSDYQKSIENLESLKVHHYHLENYDPTMKNINIYNKNQSQLDSMFGLSLLQRMGSKQEFSQGINKLREHFKKDAQKYANYNGTKYYQIMSNQELDTKENRTSLIYQMKNFKSALDMGVDQKKIKIKQFAEHQIEEKEQKIEEKVNQNQRFVKDHNEKDENQNQNLNNSKKVNQRNKSTTYRGTTQLYDVIPKNLITAQDVQFFQNLKKKQEEKQNKKLSHLSLDKSLLNNLKHSKSSLSTAVSNIETSNLK
ncbi:hypothetical protein PPERSA_00570 [Pseudocohnilembus persalinus]|uniref:Uncharacterized protein n=1 Tax=Pseudocohnilembus persalinus TaxID=266149 RepID=A0A0V0QTN6_PSEPJ|nr:hypothetical protein PPERSA_00570 [Pseudocohnilembus persalinus]|eukprot:KRX05269.1 hypothetical protein PPERSA_00570 [Pseudocohnilembus persalinus]